MILCAGKKVHCGTLAMLAIAGTFRWNYLCVYQCGGYIPIYFACIPRCLLLHHCVYQYTMHTMCTYQYQGGRWNALIQDWRGWQSCLVNLSPNSEFLQMQFVFAFVLIFVFVFVFVFVYGMQGWWGCLVNLSPNSKFLQMQFVFVFIYRRK